MQEVAKLVDGDASVDEVGAVLGPGHPYAGMSRCTRHAHRAPNPRRHRATGEIPPASPPTTTTNAHPMMLAVGRNDVAVVRPTREGRRRGGQALWMQGVAGDPVTDALEEWCRLGGPGLSPAPPALLDRHATPPQD